MQPEGVQTLEREARRGTGEQGTFAPPEHDGSRLASPLTGERREDQRTPSAHDARRRLAAEQERFLAALNGGPPPVGFDVDALAVTATSLAHKRSRTAALVWPRLSRQLGAEWERAFTEHVAPTPLLRLHGPLCDGWRLAEALDARGALTVGAAQELALVRLRFSRMSEGAERRWGVLRVGHAGDAWFLSLFGKLIGLR